MENYTEKLLNQLAHEPSGHDRDHTLRVLNNALRLAAHYPHADLEVIRLACLVHDLYDHKFGYSDDDRKTNIRILLTPYSICDQTIARVITIVNTLSFDSGNPNHHFDDIEGQIVQDSDRLDALGAIGIARTFAYGGFKQRPMADSLQHFEDKLFKLSALMNTPEGRAMSIERHDYMLAFIAEYKKESL